MPAVYEVNRKGNSISQGAGSFDVPLSVTNFGTNTAFSISFRIMLTSHGNYAFLFQHGNYNTKGLQIDIFGGQLRFIRSVASGITGALWTWNNKPPINTLTDVCITVGGNADANHKLYYNGVLQTKASSSALSSGDNTTPALVWNCFLANAYLNNLKIFDRELTAEEVLKNSKINKYAVVGSASSALIANYLFKEKTGNTVANETGNANASLSGMVTSLGSTNRRIDENFVPIAA